MSVHHLALAVLTIGIVLVARTCFEVWPAQTVSVMAGAIFIVAAQEGRR